MHHTWSRGIKLFFAYSTLLSMKFQLLIKTKIPKSKEVPCCWHFNIYEQDKILCSAELSLKTVFLTRGADLGGIKVFFILNLTEHEISAANKNTEK